MTVTDPQTQQNQKLILNRVKEFLADDMNGVVNVLDTVYHVEGDLMQQVADYLVEARGKMLRPALVCLSARAHGLDVKNSDHHINLGASIELFHVATLLHDDVIDKADMRRGRPTVNAKWGDDAAILFADYLYATSFDLALSTLNAETLRVMTQTTQRMTEGEFLQMERRGDWLSVDDYMTIINRKTAQLFSAAAGLGALIAEADSESVKRMLNFGLEFGLAFQITDDTLDYEAQNVKWGKRVGADLKEGKQTLPLLYTLKQCSEDDKAELVKTLSGDRDFEIVHKYVEKYGAIPYSLDVAKKHLGNAVKAAEPIADKEAGKLLQDIAKELTGRSY